MNECMCARISSCACCVCLVGVLSEATLAIEGVMRYLEVAVGHHRWHQLDGEATLAVLKDIERIEPQSYERRRDQKSVDMQHVTHLTNGGPCAHTTGVLYVYKLFERQRSRCIASSMAE